MIAIKDGEMPICCAECFFYDEYDGFCRILCISEWEEYIKETNYSDYDWKYEKRADICPLVEIEEHKKGKWIKVSETEFGIGYQCSECGKFILTESIDGRKLEDFPYCHCGAKMERCENE